MTADRGHSGLALGVELLRRNSAMQVYFWLITLVVFGVTAGIVWSNVESPQSVWQGARWAPQTFLLIVGVFITSIHLPVYLAHGVTRRRFIIAGTFFGIANAIGFAILMQAVFLLERLVYDANGWTQFTDTVDLLSSTGQTFVSGLEFALLYFGYYLAGWMIATGFYRFRPLTGLLLIVPALLPAVLLEAGQWGAGLVPIDKLLGSESTVTTALVLGAVLVLAAWVAVAGMLRDIAVKAK